MKYKFVVIYKGEYKSIIKEFNEIEKEDEVKRFNEKYKGYERWYFRVGRQI